jgi:type II secretory pathway component PulF
MKKAPIVVGNVILFAVLCGFFFALVGKSSWIPDVLIVAFCGWWLFTYFHYTYLRQEELLHLMTTAAEADSPIGPAIWAYLSDRPRRGAFERKLEQLALSLEAGEPLAGGLRATPGLVPRETVLAATVGEASGKLAVCLRNAPRLRLGTAWLEALPRFLYPAHLLLVMMAILTFLIFLILPKFEKIYHDFHFQLPAPTRHIIAFRDSFFGRPMGWALLIIVLALAIPLLIISPTWRWYCPGIGRLSRMNVQSRLLSMLGILLETERPLPQALDLLADSGYFRTPATQRLERARQSVERGEPLAPSLHQQELLPTRMVALVQTAERTGTLPNTLVMLGNHLAERAANLIRRFSMISFPLVVIAFGILVGYIALAWFLPLIKMITELNR